MINFIYIPAVFPNMNTPAQAIMHFVNNADYEESVPRVDKNQPKYCTYRLNDEEWLFVAIVHEVLQVSYFNASVRVLHNQL